MPCISKWSEGIEHEYIEEEEDDIYLNYDDEENPCIVDPELHNIKSSNQHDKWLDSVHEDIFSLYTSIIKLRDIEAIPILQNLNFTRFVNFVSKNSDHVAI